MVFAGQDAGKRRIAFRPVAFASAALCVLLLHACEDSGGDAAPPTRNDHGKARPFCVKTPHTRVSLWSPEVMVDGWSDPVRLSAPITTLCLEDAVTISPDGERIFFMYAADLLANLGGDMLSFPNGTYTAARIGGPGEFSFPTFYELGLGVDLSFDSSVFFSPDGSEVYFHSNRASNTGYLQGVDDYLDIYVADVVDGVPGIARNLGEPVNSIYPDGEAALHPDGVTLYFASLRPGPAGFSGGAGRGNLWRSVQASGGWSEPEFLCAPNINRPFTEQKQPAFTPDGKTMYFVSDHQYLFHGAAIYRSDLDAEGLFGSPQLVVRGNVGEPSLTGDGRCLYFVHVLADIDGGFDTDIYYIERVDD